MFVETSFGPNCTYYDASCSVFPPCHYPYAILTTAISIAFIILPSLFIFLHPCKIFNRCRNFQCRPLQVVNEVAKVFQQSFKAGTENTLARLQMVCRYLPSDKDSRRHICELENSTTNTSITGLMLVAVFQPHTPTPYNVLDSLFFM